MTVTRRNPVVLVISDGWGYRENPDANAIAAADIPVWDRLWAEHPDTLLNISGASVGPPQPAEMTGKPLTQGLERAK